MSVKKVIIYYETRTQNIVAVKYNKRHGYFIELERGMGDTYIGLYIPIKTGRKYYNEGYINGWKDWKTSQYLFDETEFYYEYTNNKLFKNC